MFKGNIMDIMRQAQQMGESLKAKQDELAQHSFDVAAGGDLVKMTFNGKGEALSIHIDESLLGANTLKPEDLRMLEDLVLSAVNLGIRQSQEHMQQEMGKLAGGLKIPGLTT